MKIEILENEMKSIVNGFLPYATLPDPTMLSYESRYKLLTKLGGLDLQAFTILHFVMVSMFLSHLREDEVVAFLLAFIDRYGVDNAYTYKHNTNLTPAMVAFLDQYKPLLFKIIALR
jgi:hypothetical protein